MEINNPVSLTESSLKQDSITSCSSNSYDIITLIDIALNSRGDERIDEVYLRKYHLIFLRLSEIKRDNPEKYYQSLKEVENKIPIEKITRLYWIMAKNKIKNEAFHILNEQHASLIS